MSTLESFPGWDRAATGLPEQRRVMATTDVMVNGPDDVYVERKGGSRGLGSAGTTNVAKDARMKASRAPARSTTFGQIQERTHSRTAGCDSPKHREQCGWAALTMKEVGHGARADAPSVRGSSRSGSGSRHRWHPQ